MKDNNAFAEVIESSLYQFIGQSWQWDTFPPFGSLVVIREADRTLFGMIHHITTGSMDPVRYPFAYQKTEEELKEQQPQIFEFLKTTFTCLIVGYQSKNHIIHLLPQQPAKIHAFIEPPPPSLRKKFFSSHHYLHLLFNLSSQLFNLDELILAIIRQQTELKILNQDTLKEFLQTFSLLTSNDYRRLKLLLQRASPLLRNNNS